MTLGEDILQAGVVEKMPNSPYSSEGEDAYDESSYGSDFQPPDLTPGFVQVHEDCCRARYRKSRAAPSDPYYICLNKSTCRSLAGGHHTVLRGGHRAEPGTYEGIFSPSGKLVAAKSGTRTTPESVKEVAWSIRESDRAQAAAIEGLTVGAMTGGLLSSKMSIQQAETLVAEPDQEVEGDVSETLVGNPSGNNAMFLDVLSSLVKRIEKLDERLTKTDMANSTILLDLKSERDREREKTASILRSVKHRAGNRTKDRDAISSVAQKHAAATGRTRDGSEFDSKAVVEIEEGAARSSDEESEGKYVKDEWWMGDKEWGPYDKHQQGDPGHWSDSSEDKGRKAMRKKRAARKQTSGLRLYAIARG